MFFVLVVWWLVARVEYSDLRWEVRIKKERQDIPLGCCRGRLALLEEALCHLEYVGLRLRARVCGQVLPAARCVCGGAVK